MESFKLGEVGFDEHDISSSPSLEEKIHFDDTMLPIYDDCNENYECLTPTITNEDFTYVESSDSFMHVAHDKNVLCDIHIVESIHDATENYYERGKHGYTYFNNIKFPLFMLKVLKLHLIYLSMLAIMCFFYLFHYKMPMHRKWVRLKNKLFNIFLVCSLCFNFLLGLSTHLCLYNM
jgi:hypothetical protein